MQGVARKMEILILKTEKNLYYTQPGNREWVILIECVLLTGRKLGS